MPPSCRARRLPQTSGPVSINRGTPLGFPGPLRGINDTGAFWPYEHDNGPCPGRRPAGDPATDSDCTVTFRKSTANSGAYTISASIDWQVHWEGSGGQNEALPAPPNAPIGNRNVQVDEVQTVVNGQPTPRG